jgi:hypothetical protein
MTYRYRNDTQPDRSVGKQILSNRETLDGLVRCFDGACYELLKLVGTSETASRGKEKFDFTSS